MRICGHVAILELNYWVIRVSLPRSYGSDDSPGFCESLFWKESEGPSPCQRITVGGWGDPNADFIVPDGAFRN